MKITLKYPRCALSAVTILVLGLAISGGSSLARAADAAPRLERSQCATEVLVKMRAVCYEFTGPENWDHPNGRTVTLPIAVLTDSETDPDQPPVFFFQGGPGTSVLDSESWIRTWWNDVKPRTLVVLDPRGVWHTKPALLCPGIEVIDHYWRRFAPNIFGLKSLDERIKQHADYVKSCYEKLKSEGVDVTQYTDFQVARDVDEIRKAFGYKTINVYGWSGGTGTILTYLKYYGAHLRSAIVLGPWPHHVTSRPPIRDLYDAQQQWIDFLAICVRENKECASRFPDYMYELDRARAILDAKPYITTIASEMTPTKRLKIRIDGATLMSWLYINMEDKYHLLPKALESIKRGDYAALNDFFDLDKGDTPATARRTTGHFNTRMCGDLGKNRVTPQEATAMIKREPALIGFEQPVFCGWWGEDGDVPPDMNTPPVSNVPLLAIHGQFDGCCGMRNSESMVRTMPNLQRVEIQAEGHDGGRACRGKLVSAFLNAPDAKLDDSCKDDVPLRPWVFYQGGDGGHRHGQRD